jgi:hypothetical protein
MSEGLGTERSASYCFGIEYIVFQPYEENVTTAVAINTKRLNRK